MVRGGSRLALRRRARIWDAWLVRGILCLPWWGTGGLASFDVAAARDRAVAVAGGIFYVVQQFVRESEHARAARGRHSAIRTRQEIHPSWGLRVSFRLQATVDVSFSQLLDISQATLIPHRPASTFPQPQPFPPQPPSQLDRSSIVDRLRRLEPDQALAVAGPELALLVPVARRLGQLLYLAELELFLPQQVVHAARVLGRDVVDLGEVFLLH